MDHWLNLFPAEQGGAQEHQGLFLGPPDPSQVEIATQFLPHTATSRRGGNLCDYIYAICVNVVVTIPTCNTIAFQIFFSLAPFSIPIHIFFYNFNYTYLNYDLLHSY